MVATAIYAVTMVLWKETAFPLCRAMERRWKRNVVCRVSSVIVVIRLPLFHLLLKVCSEQINCTELTGARRPSYTTRSLVTRVSVTTVCFALIGCSETGTVSARLVLITCIQPFTLQEFVKYEVEFI